MTDEQELRRVWDAGDYRTVTKLALERYGPEIIAVLKARLRSESDAWEVFSLFTEALWRGLPGFQWRSTLRAWAYRIARNAIARWATGGERKPERNVPMDELCEIADRVRSSTLVYLRTQVKSKIRRLRDELPEADQMLLILRIDKQLRWDEIAAALANEDLAGDDLKREAARLRKRLQFVIEKLRVLALERGLLTPEDRQY